MFTVEISFPPHEDLQSSTSSSSLFKKTYRSLRHASIELKVSYYFLYNCYHLQHNNQFTRFFKIYRVDKKGNKLPYRLPKKKKNKNLKQLSIKTSDNIKKRKKNNKNQVSKKHKKKKNIEQDERVSNGEVNTEEHDTGKHVPKKTWCGHWKLWSLGV